MIEINNLGKKYRIRATDSLLFDEKNIFSRFLAKLQFLKKKDKWAIKNINLDIDKGSIVAVMGDNGSGKSTLLRLLSEISDPTEGSITLRGTVSPMLEAGVGFHPELTGRENIYLNGNLLGIGRRELVKKFEEIVTYAEITEYLDTPMKRYSSGMFARLAFAVATHLNRDILIVDEVLSISDISFREKSIKRLQNLARQGITILIVSHDVELLRSICDQAVLLKDGTLIKHGKYQEIHSLYYGEQYSVE
ncbi:MAG: ATP-binding cassette domain-containing protein [Alteromonadaceae bacterium]|nr:ATP-binding cassette domain-containing protein [Alteromonadaceae bacterium]